MKRIILILIVITLVYNCAHASLAEYPISADVEPKINLSDDGSSATINAGIENVIDVNLEDCLRLALGNNPKIQSAMQDVFASDARLKQVWSNYFPQLSWQSGYSRIRQLQLSDVFQENLIYNFKGIYTWASKNGIYINPNLSLNKNAQNDIEHIFYYFKSNNTLKNNTLLF